MGRYLVGFLVLGLFALAATTNGNAQEKNTKWLQDLVAKFPTPAKKDGKLAEVDKAATDAAVAKLLADPEKSVIGLVNMLSTKGGDVQVRHALHAMVIRAGDKKYKAARQAAAQALAETLNTDRPKEIQVFVVRQLQLIGTAKETTALGPLLLDPNLAEPAAQALLAIKTDAAIQFRAALPKAAATQRALIVHGLGTLKDKKAAHLLRKLLDDKNRDTRLTAAWALARLPDASSAPQLLKLADAAKGYERSNATDACFLLAENLLAGGNKTAARQIYSHLHKSRTDEAELYVRKAAAKGLAKTK